MTINAGLFESRWVFYKPLLFLADHLRSRFSDFNYDPGVDANHSLIEDSPITEDDDTNLDYKHFNDHIQKLPQLSPPALAAANGSISSSVIASTSKTLVSQTPPPLVPVSIPPLSKKPQVKRQRVEDDNSETSGSKAINIEDFDDDYHFLMSLHPFMGQMTSARKLRMRLKIQEVIMKELFDETDDLE